MDVPEIREFTYCVYENKLRWLAVNNNKQTFNSLKFGDFF